MPHTWADSQGLDIFAEAILRASGASPSPDPLEALLAQDAQPRVKRTAAAALLRAIGANRNILDARTRARVRALFDASFEDLYKLLRIEAKQQSYEKEGALLGALQKIEDDVTAEVSALLISNDLRRSQERILRLLRSAPAKALLSPFLPQALVGDRLEDLFSLSEEFLEATPDRFVSTYDSARSSLEVYSDEAKQFGTGYADAVLGGTATNLLARIETVYSESDLTAPATLEILAGGRKYPLSEADVELDVALRIMNKGPGFGGCPARRRTSTAVPCGNYAATRVTTSSVVMGGARSRSIARASVASCW